MGAENRLNFITGNNPGKIRIPREYFHTTTKLPMDLEYPVIPINDPWLLAKERTPQEIDETIEGRLQAIQANFNTGIETGESTNIAGQYGATERIGGNLGRLLAYAELLDEYRTVKEAHMGKASRHGAHYEEEKAEIKKKYTKPNGKIKGVAFKEMTDRWKVAYNPVIQEQEGLAKEADTVQNLIMKKAVLEFLSCSAGCGEREGYSFRQLPVMLDEAKKIFPHGGDSDFSRRKPLDYFIERLASYLSETNSSGLFNAYKYRGTAEIVTKRTDAAILKEIMGFMLIPDHYTEDSETQRQISSLAASYFDFLKHRAYS